jgi:hypothetical protein
MRALIGTLTSEIGDKLFHCLRVRLKLPAVCKGGAPKHKRVRGGKRFAVTSVLLAATRPHI